LEGLNLVDELRANENSGVSNEIPRHISKDLWEIIRDYLCEVSEEWNRYMIINMQSHVLENIPLDIVITYSSCCRLLPLPHAGCCNSYPQPKFWPYEAMNKIYRAFVGAFPKRMFPSLQNTYFTSEPEACALYIHCSRSDYQGSQYHYSCETVATMEFNAASRSSQSSRANASCFAALVALL
jgi:hypothetical protein